jgi:hypothetical protein
VFFEEIFFKGVNEVLNGESLSETIADGAENGVAEATSRGLCTRQDDVEAGSRNTKDERDTLLVMGYPFIEKVAYCSCLGNNLLL